MRTFRPSKSESPKKLLQDAPRLGELNINPTLISDNVASICKGTIPNVVMESIHKMFINESSKWNHVKRNLVERGLTTMPNTFRNHAFVKKSLNYLILDCCQAEIKHLFVSKNRNYNNSSYFD